MSAHTSRATAGDWLWNLALYPLVFGMLSVVLVLMELAFPGIEDVPLHALEDPAGLMLSGVLGMTLYWGPGVAVSLASLALLSRLPDAPLRRLARLVTPLVVVGTWVVILFMAGYEFVFLTADRGDRIALPGWIATAIALLVVGAMTRIERR